MQIRRFRIHGDNIVECERTLKMVAEAYDATCEPLHSPVYRPKYSVETKDCAFIVELLSGHGRWGNTDLGDLIHEAGGQLRESADSYLTEVAGAEEKILLAIEYCSALPAGNNAWQRNGRALASVFANVPYLYFAEIGGVELDEKRVPKAPRYPNPAVPFSYVALSHDTGRVCLPVYRAHPSMTPQSQAVFKQALGYNDSLVFIRELLDGEDTEDSINSLKAKTIKMVEILTGSRRRVDTLEAWQWDEFLTSSNRSIWLINNYGEDWQKKMSDKVLVSDTFKLLKSKIQQLPAVPVAAKDLPLCVIPKSKLNSLKSWLKKTYNGLDVAFDSEKDLALVWITGFKPHGEDSRPDRGLAPLCRMILGKDANIMAIVSGPAKKETWGRLFDASDELCKSNGLFEAIFSCCNYLFVDSATSDNYIFMETGATFRKSRRSVRFPYEPEPPVRFSEYDTDCAIHQILSVHKELGVYECFCNPPGGDWSGISFFMGKREYKWTSLPRVSANAKRPDHIFQIERAGRLIFVVIESKGYGKDIENSIGVRLKDYVEELFENKPTAYKPSVMSEWRFFDGTIGNVRCSLVSVGAFLYRDEDELRTCLRRGDLDAVFAFEFGLISKLHFCANDRGFALLEYLNEIALEQRGFIVKVHRL